MSDPTPRAVSEDRTAEWRRGMLEAAEICRSYAATARMPSPFDDETTAEHRALAYDTAAEVIESRVNASQKLRAEEIIGRASDEAPSKSRSH
jgi:hypothetical protein